jgi:hypothetical protein
MNCCGNKTGVDKRLHYEDAAKDDDEKITHSRPDFISFENIISKLRSITLQIFKKNWV